LQQTHLDGTTHEQTIICRQLFTGHLVGSRPVKRKKKNASNDKKIYFSVVNNKISEHPEAFAHLLVCHLAN